LFDIFVVGYFKSIPFATLCSFTHINGRHSDYELNAMPFGVPLLSGSEVVRKAIYPDAGCAADPRFEPYRVRLPIITIGHAEKCAKGYVDACCSELAQQTDPEMSKITGGRVHLARVTAEKGFEWICEARSRRIA
jgi:hypothetical protein